jgi:hypothetical protein
MVRVRWPGWALGFLVATVSQLGAQERPPPRVELWENYPNPFLSSTTIPFTIYPEVCERGHQPQVSLKIYNVLVQLVAIPVLQQFDGEPVDDVKLNCGTYEAFWDGKFFDAKREVTPGVYYAQLVVDGQRYTGKLIARRK